MRSASLLKRLSLAAVVCWATAAGPGGSAQERLAPESGNQITLSFAPVVKRAAPAVVNVFTRTVVRDRALSPFLDDPLFRQFFGRSFGMPRERVENSLGSGVIVRRDGLVVTNAHVVKDSDQVTVVLADRREFDAKRVHVDERTDLAVLRIDTKGEALPAMAFGDSDTLEVGDLVLAIGNPFGVGQTVTMGIVSAVARTAVGISDYNFFIQTDAAINPGNSGGALLGVDGRLVGINTAIYSRSGGSIGIGFAIPVNMVRTVVDAVAAGQPATRPWLGLSSQPVTAEVAQSLGLKRPAGALVRTLHALSPARAAGVKIGDVVTAVNGHPIDDPDSLRFRIATQTVGTEVQMTVFRDGRDVVVPVVVVRPPEQPPRELTPLRGSHPFSGTSVANLSPALADELELDDAASGVVVVKIEPDSVAQRVGLRRGDVVVQVNERRIDDVGGLIRSVRSPQRLWRFSVRRGNEVLNAQIRG